MLEIVILYECVGEFYYTKCLSRYLGALKA